MRIICLAITFSIILSSCYNDEDSHVKVYSQCNALLAEYCSGEQDGMYCTFGYKWGNNNPFSPAGCEVPGPGVTGGNVTYKFEKGGIIFSTHSQNEVESYDFGLFDEFYKTKINDALLEWETNCSIHFEKVNEDSLSDIRFIIADIEQTGIGYPAFSEGICTDLAGTVILRNIVYDSDTYYKLALHEIGHTLGLGHVTSDNVMNPNMQNYLELQLGDIMGIQSIYGE